MSIDDESFSDQLERWVREPGPKTMGALGEVFAEKAFAVTILLLMFLPALPLPTGGVSHVFEAITVVIAAQMVLGRRTFWLPARWKRRELGAATTEKAIPFMLRRIRWFERRSHPRGAALFDHRMTHRILGLVLMGLAVAAALAPPFSGLDTLPSMGAVAIVLAIVLEDVVILGVGLVIGAGGTLLILTVGAAVVRLLQGIF